MHVDCWPGPMYKKKNYLITLRELGYTNCVLDFSGYCSPYDLENRETQFLEFQKLGVPFDFLPYYPQNFEKIIHFFINSCQDEGITCSLAIAPHAFRDSERTDNLDIVSTLTTECINICGRIGCAKLIVYPLHREVTSDDINEENKQFYRQFIASAKKNNVRLLIPNDYVQRRGRFVRGQMTDPYFLKEFVEELNFSAESEIFGICMDLGVCNLCSQNILEFLTILGTKVHAVILKENDGEIESALLPFTAIGNGGSKVDWLNVIRGLRTLHSDCELLVDSRNSQSAISHLLTKDFLNYQKKIVDFLVWQITMEEVIKKHPSRVLFGAGNMCRNYMKCYGKEYPPLYTCDNNEKIWGTTFEGLEIKNPEELKKLPKDCAIFICNIYYEEIEKQLCDMGITNPIERFNDEYLPSMYTDRFDANKREVRK